MPWESCNLLLNSDSTGSFYSGDIVTGSVIIEFKREQTIDRVEFEVIGISKAQWTRPMPTVPYIRIYSEKEFILEYNIDIFRELEGRTVQPGIHSYHFHFRLPSDLPSSFESSVAKIHYFIKIKGKTAHKSKKQKIVPFIVRGNINLNQMEEYLDPIIVECEKTFWNSGKFSVHFKTYKGFAPKQQIPFEIDIDNEKKVRISKINIVLVQKIKYSVASGYAEDEKKIHKIEYNKFSNSVTEKCRFHMEVPQAIPSSINLTDPMVDVSYVLRLEVIFPFHFTLYEDVPVTVATIPVMHNEFEQKYYK